MDAERDSMLRHCYRTSEENQKPQFKLLSFYRNCPFSSMPFLRKDCA